MNYGPQETYQRNIEKFCARWKEPEGISLEDGWGTAEYIESKQHEMKDHLERKPAECQPQPLHTMMDWWAPSLLLWSFITESDWGSNIDEIWKCCAKPAIGLLALALSVVSYLLPNWVSGLWDNAINTKYSFQLQKLCASSQSSLSFPLHHWWCQWYFPPKQSEAGGEKKSINSLQYTKWIILHIQTSK